MIEWGSAPDWAIASFAGATTLFAFQSWRSSKKVEWLIGALESHSTVRLRMEAKRDGLNVVAWDPEQSSPSRVPMTGQEWPLDEIYLAIPPDLRRPAR
jgi:hypothetical protein